MRLSRIRNEPPVDDIYLCQIFKTHDIVIMWHSVFMFLFRHFFKHSNHSLWMLVIAIIVDRSYGAQSPVVFLIRHKILNVADIFQLILFLFNSRHALGRNYGNWKSAFISSNITIDHRSEHTQMSNVKNDNYTICSRFDSKSRASVWLVQVITTIINQMKMAFNSVHFRWEEAIRTEIVFIVRNLKLNIV